MTRRVLVVEDERIFRTICRSVLEPVGFEVEEATNAEDGLRMCGTNQYDLILTDVVMEGMDGWEFVRQLRTRPEYSVVPVIFMTSLNSREHRLKGFQLGADAYLTKPFDNKELELQARNVVERAAALKASFERDRHEPSSAGADLEGQLAQLGLGSVLTMLELERKTGSLVVSNTSSAQIAVREGRVVAIKLEGTPNPPSGVALVAHVLGWTEGTFAFHVDNVDEIADEFGCPTGHLLMQAAQYLDEGGEKD